MLRRGELTIPQLARRIGRPERTTRRWVAKVQAEHAGARILFVRTHAADGRRFWIVLEHALEAAVGSSLVDLASEVDRLREVQEEQSEGLAAQARAIETVVRRLERLEKSRPLSATFGHGAPRTK